MSAMYVEVTVPVRGWGECHVLVEELLVALPAGFPEAMRLARGLLAREDVCNGLVQAIRLGPFRAVSVPEGWEALLPAMADVERERVVLRVGAACGEAWYEGEVPDLG